MKNKSLWLFWIAFFALSAEAYFLSFESRSDAPRQQVAEKGCAYFEEERQGASLQSFYSSVQAAILNSRRPFQQSSLRSPSVNPDGQSGRGASDAAGAYGLGVRRTQVIRLIGHRSLPSYSFRVPKDYYIFISRDP